MAPARRRRRRQVVEPVEPPLALSAAAPVTVVPIRAASGGACPFLAGRGPASAARTPGERRARVASGRGPPLRSPDRRRDRVRPAPSASASCRMLQADERIGRIVGIARRPFDPARARLDEDDLPPRRRARPGRPRGGLRGRRRRRPPRLHDHGQGLARHDPRDQRRGHAEHLPRGRRRRGAAVRLRVVGGRLRLPPATTPCRITEDWPVRPAGAAVLRAGEGRGRAAAGGRGGAPPRPRRSTSCGRPSCSARTPSAPRTSSPARCMALGRPAGRPRRAGLPLPLPVLAPQLPLQFIHEEDVGQALPALRRRRRGRRARTTSPATAS